MQNLVFTSITAGTNDEATDYEVDAVIFVTKESCAIIVIIKANIKRLQWRRQD